MRQNRVRQTWAEGRPVILGWLSIGNDYSAEIMANQGFDGVNVDLQHGMIGTDAAISILQGISTTPAAPFVRVPTNEPGIVMKMLDAGAYGVICPLVNSRAECEAFVQACKYPPQGIRSYGPARARLYGGGDYAQHANDTIITLAMIETKEALECVDDIVAVDGLDGVFIGPSDLNLSFGHDPSSGAKHPEVARAIETIREAAHKQGRKAGLFCPSGEEARRMIAEGFDLVTTGNDVGLLAGAAKAAVDAARS